MLRLFFALWPDDPVRAALADAARTLRQRLHPGGRATPAEQLHLTVQFLGGYPVLPADIVARASTAAASLAVEAFPLAIDRASSFDPRVWWLGPSETPAALTRLHARLRDALRKHAVPHERGERFTPHVTIVRAAGHALPPTPIAPVAWPVGEFALIVSEEGAAHRVLGRWPLVLPLAAPRQAGLFDA